MHLILFDAVYVHRNTVHMFNKIPDFHFFYVAYLKSDPAQEPIAASYSAPGVLAEAATQNRKSESGF